MSSCLFCKIIAGELPSEKVYEDDRVIAILDINPVNPGHTLVILKEHVTQVSEASAENMQDMARVLPHLSRAVMAGVGSSGCNIGINNGAMAGQLVPHLHIHIMPRFENDGHDLWHGQPYAEGEKQKVGEKIRSQIA